MFNFIHENMSALIGAFIPVLGSVFLIHYTNFAEGNRKYQLYFRRACELVKYNMEIAHSRIINKSDNIEFTQDNLSNVLSDMESTGVSKSKNLYNDIFELVFSIRVGEQLAMKYGDFYKIVFEQTRKTKSNFVELAKIVDSVGIEKVYEFKILRLLILLANKMGIETYFNQYYELVKSITPEVDVETCIRYYIVELINQNRNGVSNKIYFVEYANNEKLIHYKPYTNLQVDSVEIKNIISKIKDQFEKYKNIINEHWSYKVWSDFLNEIKEDSITLETKGVDKVIESLEKIYDETEYVYLSFLGICENGDALDNNRRSRQKEDIEQKKENKYVVSKRGWFLEAEAEGEKVVTVTSPYVDTSKSYVVSFVKKIFINKKLKGILGLDVVVDELIQDVIKDENINITIFTSEGEIIFDNVSQGNTQKVFFNNIFMKRSINLHNLIQNNSSRFIFENNKRVYFSTVVKNRYYCIIY